MNYLILGFVGPWQIVVIVVLVLLLFGGRKIPELMRGIGQGMTEFKKARKQALEEDVDSTKKPEAN